jgi:arylsulfatase A-like enzyme
MSGSAYAYDRHVPFVIYGGGVASQSISKRVSTEQIASTLADLMGVERPLCSDAEVLTLEKN